MAIEEMKKVHLVGHQHIENRVVGVLQRLGIVEVINIREKKEKRERFSAEEEENLEERLSQIDRILKFFNRYEKVGFLTGLWDSFFPPKAYFKKDEARHIRRSFSEVKSFSVYKELEEGIDRLKIRREQLKEEKKQLVYYRSFPLSKRDLRPLKTVDSIWGIINRKAFLKISPVLNKQFKEVWIKTFKNDIKSLFLIVTFHKDSKKKLIQFLDNSDFQYGAFSKAQEGTCGERLKRITEEEYSLGLAEQKTNQGIQIFLRQKPKLLLLYDTVSSTLKQRYANENFFQTRSTFVLEGWIKAGDVKVLQNKLIKIFPDLEAVVSSAPADSKPPVAFQNNALVKPFEFITKLYGAPNYYEFDPTPLFFPFFVFFFALCITDAGYGLLLLLLGMAAVKKMKLAPEQKSIFKVLIICGIFTILLGLLMGSIFCLDFSNLPKILYFLKGFQQKIMVIDPLQDIMLFLSFCLGLGVIQIYFGIFLKIIMLLKRKKVMEALLEELPWIFLLSGLILCLGVYLGGISGKLLPMAKIFSLGGAGVILFFSARGTKNIFLRLGKGLFKLYGTVGMFGDILSYSRLLALGLATTVIGLAVNIIAGLCSKVPFIGFFLGLAIVVLGHGFNIFINSLGAFAHTLRLQFVEFFTKFYEGGGEFFQPFKLENKFTKVET